MRYLRSLIITVLFTLLLVACKGEDVKTEEEDIIGDTTDSTLSLINNVDEEVFSSNESEAIEQVPLEYIIQMDNNEFNLNDVESIKQLWDLDDESLALLRNSIYAKYGYYFKSEKYKTIFAKYKWYEVSDDFSETLFLDKEIKFIDTIKLIENRRKKKVIENTIITLNDEKFRLVMVKENEAIDSLTYNRIEIFSEKTGELMFDTSSFEYYDGDTIDGTKNYEIIEEYSLLHFTDYAYASDLPKQLFLKLEDEECEIVFFDNFYGMKWIDIDENGKNELYGYIYGGGQVSYDHGFRMAFEYVNGEGFVMVPELTRTYEIQVLEETKTNFSNNPSVDGLENLLWIGYTKLDSYFKVM